MARALEFKISPPPQPVPRKTGLREFKVSSTRFPAVSNPLRPRAFGGKNRPEGTALDHTGRGVSDALDLQGELEIRVGLLRRQILRSR